MQINEIALYPRPMFQHSRTVIGIYCRRNSTSRTAGGRIQTQDAYTITTVGTVLRSLSTSFDLPTIYRCFSRMLQPPYKPSSRLPRLCKVEPQYSLRVFVGFGSPWKDGRKCIPLRRKGAVIVRDGYKRSFSLSFL
ncbi:hypothetical protein AVEN_73899-1 [Araneus ventricosus]|uniref:Uncharacterized protein n=1 Tax=Araneus ventricosus TaxID=182803 RepID=A0A4Y2VFV2_ARAVE|nr:hypothetical protein AVEN_73899-1 [Araneus ventricosus]